MPEGQNRSVIIHQLSKRRSQVPFSKSKGLVQCVLFHPIRPFFFVAVRNIACFEIICVMKYFLFNTKHISFIHSFTHSISMCRMRWFLAVLRSFFHSSLLCIFSCHPSSPTIFSPSLVSSCHLFLGLPLSLVVPKFIYNTLLGILFSSILCTCPNQRNLFNPIVCTIVGFLTLA